MERIFSISLIALLVSIAASNAQTLSDHRKYKEYSKYLIARDSIKATWPQTAIGFNQGCDIIFFQNTYYSVPKFNKAFKTFLSNKTVADTIIFQLDYGNDVSLHTLLKSFRILAKQIDKYKACGTYYFSMYPPSAEEMLIQTDTINLFMNNNIITYNGKAVTKAELAEALQRSKPDRVIIYAVPELPVEDLLDIMEIGEKSAVPMILQSKIP